MSVLAIAVRADRPFPGTRLQPPHSNPHISATVEMLAHTPFDVPFAVREENLIVQSVNNVGILWLVKVARHGALTHSLAFNQVLDLMFHDLIYTPCPQALLVRRCREQPRGGTKIPNPATVKYNTRMLRGKGNKRSGIMFSGRFDGGPKEAFLRATAVRTLPPPLLATISCHSSSHRYQ